MNNQLVAPVPSLKSSVMFTILARVLVIGLGLITNIITARFLGPEGRGEYFFVITVATIIIQFGNFGLHAGNTYWVARDPTLLGGLLANSFWLSLLAGGLAVIAVWLTQVFHFFPGIPVWQLWVAAALAPFMLFYMLGVNLLVGIHRIKAFSFFEIANRLAGCIGLVIAAWMLGKVFEFLAAALIAMLIVVIVLFVFLYQRYGDGLRFKTALFTRGFQYALKAYIMALISILISQSSILLLRQLSGSKEVGYYSVSFNFGSILAILPASMALVLFPRLVCEKNRQREITLGSTALVGGIMLVACLLTACLAKPLVTLLFGSEFQPAVPVLYWMLPGIFFSSMVNILSQYLAAVGFPWILAGVWAAGFLIVLGLSYLLIPICQGIGVAIAVSITQAFLLVTHLALVRFGKFSIEA